MIGGLVLAAGGGRRLGRPKAAVRYRGTTLAQRAVKTLTAGGCSSVHVVLGPVDVPDLTGATRIFNAAWSDGLGSSLRAGLANLPATLDAVVVVLADQPLVTPAAVRRIVAAHAAGSLVVVAEYARGPGHPVLFDRQVWSSLWPCLTGDAGARGFLRARPDLVTTVPCADVAAPDDIDRPVDRVRLSRG